MLLMTPGPTRVPERVLRAGARAMLHHRSPEFSVELAEMLALLAPVFGTQQPVLPVHTTGRGATEAAICNFFSAGDEIVVCCNGKFGEMWAAFAESYGLTVHRFATDWSQAVDAGALAAWLADHPRVCAVALTYSDSATGVCNDVEAVARMARDHDALVMVDGVSSIGGMPFAFDAWDIDVAVTASQKCLMSAPGLAFAVVSDRAWSRAKHARLPRNYWDFRAIRNAVTATKCETPGTTPVHLVFQVTEALRMIHEEGLNDVYSRHERMAHEVRQQAAALGLALQCPVLGRFASTLTALATPAGLAPRTLRDAMKARGILTAAGLGPFERTGFRIGHLGDIRLSDVERTMTALGDALRDVQEDVQRDVQRDVQHDERA